MHFVLKFFLGSYVSGLFWGVTKHAQQSYHKAIVTRVEDKMILENCNGILRTLSFKRCDESEARYNVPIVVHILSDTIGKLPWCGVDCDVVVGYANVLPVYVYLIIFVISLPSILKLVTFFSPRHRALRQWKIEDNQPPQ